MKRLSKYIVYGLVDPRDDVLFYVGKSCNGTKAMLRHTQPHSLNSLTNPAKSERIREILDEGLDLMYIVLEECRSKKQVEMRERVFIARYRNDDILNIVMKGKNMLADPQPYKYKGYEFWEDIEEDDDVRKIWHNVRKPDGTLTFVHWSPYNSMSFEDFKMWIDLDMPGRVQTLGGSSNLSSKDLLEIRAQRASGAIEDVIRTDGND